MDKFLRRWILCSFFWALALAVAGGPAFAETAKRKSGPEVKNIVVLVCDGCGFNHFAAHNVSRDNYAEIAREMIYASAVDIIMGCGGPDYDNSGEKLEKLADTRYVGGPDTWRDLVDDGSVRGADADGDGDGDDWVVIRDRVQFQGLAGGETPARVIGIPRVSTTLQQARGGDRHADPFAVPLIPTVPTLEEMTLAALNVLDNDPDGFLLVVEGGAVDWASHANQSGRMIEEQIDFNEAVAAVVDWVRRYSHWGETLVVVTADHECGYLAGPGSNPARLPIVNNGAGNLPGMEWHSDDHTNSLVPFYAEGAGARFLEAEADEMDSVRGNYLDNAEMGRVLIELLTR